ncbi:S-adenosyl-L-methionine-dependent methyltransferase [Aulographum hederae CBS 113979]|uniref:S-adenosyl-L-methionine-dependent methyltransferase n=1 Tax=Aulographum hederae CBS 113979 TaxID=1176131 RepID=A0A6G1GZM5_9PEZI|nr:S-adenosyl-L-methionine-dependent methyltransferase [Aulographum hederae CBS 113979]
MARGKRGGFRNNRGRGGRGGGSQQQRSDYADVEKHNDQFENYYNDLGIVADSEREEFWTALRRELPNSFRFTGSKGHALAVQQRLIDHYIPEIVSVRHDGKPVDPPQQLEWFPEKLAWSMTTPKQVVRKFAPFSSFQKFLVSETSVGNISRQEVVSMIPPLVMDIQQGMTVLDMCAAPGSKSAQLIEAVHGGEEGRIRKVLHKIANEQGRELSPDGKELEFDMAHEAEPEEYEDYGRATGLLIANDADYRRAQMLVHQVKRLNSPNLMVMNHDATQFPSIKVPGEPGQPPRYLKFDRILADVPCSGDGTARKNPNVWKDWSTKNGLGLHLTQVRILVRALQMLKVGGRVVYSTCSLNPVENEAVISGAIARCGGVSKVHVVDCSTSLPGLKRNSGLSQWKIMDGKGRMWSSWNEVEKAKEEEGSDSLGKLVESMFPVEDVTEDEKMPLERCMRVYPHMQDTGGFFITVLEKKTEIKARPENVKPTTTATPAATTTETKPATTTEKKPATTTTMSIVDEINEQAENGTLGKRRLSTVDKIAPFKYDPDDDVHSGYVPPVVHQNEGLPPPAPSPTTKRPLEDAETAESAPKKVKTENGQNGHVKAEVVSSAVATPKLDPSNNSKKRSNQPHEEPFKYLPADHSEVKSIFDFYDVSEQFPRDRFMVRNASGEPVKAIYYTSTTVRDILTENEGKGLKFVHCGVRMFQKQDAQGQDICRWRIQSDGLPILEAWVGEDRIVRLYKRSTLHKLLKEMFPRVGNDGWKELGEVGERVRDIGMGCCVLRVETSDAEDGFAERMVLPLWRSISALNLMLPKEERKAMLLRLYNDNSPLIDHSQLRFGKKDTEAETPVNATAADGHANGVDDAEEGAEATVMKDDDVDMDDGVEGGVPLETALNPELDVAATGIPTSVAVDENKSMLAEDAMKAAAQQKVDDLREVAPGVTDEEDAFNKTV